MQLTTAFNIFDENISLWKKEKSYGLRRLILDFAATILRMNNDSWFGHRYILMSNEISTDI